MDAESRYASMDLVEIVWVIGPLIFGVLLGWAWVLLSLTPAEFKRARTLIWAAPIPLLGACIMWAITTDSPFWVRAAVVGVVGAFAFIGVAESLRWVSSREGLAEMPTGSSRTKRSFDLDAQKQFIKLLKDNLPDNGYAEISFTSLEFRQFAETLDSLFKSAGWKTIFNKSPIGAHQKESVPGLGVTGYNKFYVESVLDIFTKMGIADTYSEIRETDVPESSPKWPMVQKKIYVTIGFVKDGYITR